MKSGLKDYICEWSDKLNVDLMNKSNEKPLVEYILDVWRSLEAAPQISFKGYEYTEKESEIDINKHIFKREKKLRKKDRVDYKFINDDRVGKLTVYLEIRMLVTDPTTNETTYQVYPVKKAMLIPLQDENGYFSLRGKKYYLIYQLLEKSTYTSSNSVTLKSAMPVAVKRNTIDCTDINDKVYKLPAYYVYVFKKEIPIILFYLAHGIDFTMSYLDLIHVIDFVEELPTDANKLENNLYFTLSSRCYLQVNKEMFENTVYVQSIVGAFCTVCTNRVTIESLNDPKQWIKKMTNPNNYEKGLGVLKYIKRLMDDTTLDVLVLPKYYTRDIYSILKWTMQNFNELRLKDNCDLANKRLRCNEYIASLLSKKFNDRLLRIISLGDKATVDNIKELFKFPGDTLIQSMHTSGILRFNDQVNDQNFWSKFKFTSKGPNAIGSNNSNNIGMKYRAIHPSHLGQLDILVCGNSDPGTSGLLSPFSPIEGLYFDNSDEPDATMYNMHKDIENICKKDGTTFVKFTFDNPKDYYDMISKLIDFSNENIHLYESSIENSYDLIVNEDSDMDDHTKPSTIALQKKKKKKPDEESEEETESEEISEEEISDEEVSDDESSYSDSEE